MIKRFYAPAFVAASLFALTACTDGNDWDVDKSHDRLFGINSNNISVEAEDVTAILSFTGVPGAQYYIVEISTDSLYDDIPIPLCSGRTRASPSHRSHSLTWRATPTTSSV